MTKPQPPIVTSYPCTECSAGIMQPRLLTYFTWLNEELITVPSFPAWVCDVCGRREYDERSISWLDMLLDPNAGEPTRKKKIAPRTRPTARPSRPAPES